MHFISVDTRNEQASLMKNDNALNKTWFQASAILKAFVATFGVPF